MVKVPADQFDIDRVRAEFVGRKAERKDGLYPVEHDPIRRHEHMCHGLNPLFLDPEYGKTSKYGTTIAPGVMTDYFGGDGTWPTWGGGEDITAWNRRPELDVPTLGDKAINLGTSWEFLKPLRIGDRIWSQAGIADVYMKPIKLDPKAVWVVNETRFYNQNDELVAVSRNTGLRHRSPEEVAADPETAGLHEN